MHGQDGEAGQGGHAARLQLQGALEGRPRRVQPPQLEGRGADAQAHLHRRLRVLPQRLAEPGQTEAGRCKDTLMVALQLHRLPPGAAQLIELLH